MSANPHARQPLLVSRIECILFVCFPKLEFIQTVRRSYTVKPRCPNNPTRQPFAERRVLCEANRHKIPQFYRE